LRDFGRALRPALKALVERVRTLEEAIAKVPAAPVTVERAEVMVPEVPPRRPTWVERIDAITKEVYTVDADFEWRVKEIAKRIGFRISRIFFETSDETRKRMGELE